MMVPRCHRATFVDADLQIKITLAAYRGALIDTDLQTTCAKMPHSWHTRPTTTRRNRDTYNADCTQPCRLHTALPPTHSTHIHITRILVLSTH